MAVLAPRDVQFFLTAEEFREWLRANHDRADEVWVAFRKKSSQLPSISYVDAVDEALCFGWIDGIQKPLDAETYCHRFTPRSRRSRWSERNTGRWVESMPPAVVRTRRATSNGIGSTHTSGAWLSWPRSTDRSSMRMRRRVPGLGRNRPHIEKPRHGGL